MTLSDYRSFPYRLDSCVWEITLGCCFRCAYCGSSGGKARENELTTEECDSVAAQLAGMGCRRVSLIGGEVFMRNDWETIVRGLTSRGIITCIITNGFVFSDRLLEALKADQERIAQGQQPQGVPQDVANEMQQYQQQIAQSGNQAAIRQAQWAIMNPERNAWQKQRAQQSLNTYSAQ